MTSAVATFQLSTDRLDLVCLDEDLAARVLLGETDATWGAGFPTDGDLVAARWVLEKPVAYRPPFTAYLVRHRARGVLIGGVGFHGWPVAGVVEVGYGISPHYRGRRYASEACRGLVEAALASGLVTKVVATTDAANVRSQGVLRHAGFVAANDRGTAWVTRR